MPKPIGKLLHAAVFLFQTIRRSIWFFTRPEAIGVHGIALTAGGKIVLVKLSYADGWRLPGGGMKPGEDSPAAMLRELREEIGLIDYGAIEVVADFAHRPDHRRGKGTLFIVRGAVYQPQWSLEVERVAEFLPDELPDTTAQPTRDLLALAASRLG